jgi:hypothetical protein
MMASTTGSGKSGPTTPTAVSPAGASGARPRRSRGAAADSHPSARRPDSNRIHPRPCRGDVTGERGRRSGGAGQRRRAAGAAMGARRQRGEREGRGAATALGSDGRERERMNGA